MIKINLLPPNLYEAQRKVWVMVLCIVVLFGVLGGSFLYKNGIDKERANWTNQANQAEALKSQADTLAAQANTILSAVKDMQDKIAFFDSVSTYNQQYPYLYEELAKFTYKKVIYSSITPDGAAGTGPNNLEIKAYAPSLADCGRYLLNMYRAQHIFKSVSIDAVPGFEAKQGTDASGNAIPGAAPAASSTGGLSIGSGVAPGAAQAASALPAPGGLSAIDTALSHAVVTGPKGFQFKVSCALSDDMADKLKPPTMGAAGPAPGTPGAPVLPAPAPARSPANLVSPTPPAGKA